MKSQTFILSFLIAGSILFPLVVHAQPMQMSTNMTSGEHAEHTIDNLVISEHIPLTGRLTVGDYLFLMDFTPFATSVEGHSHVAFKVPCNEDGSPKLTVVSGIAPNLKSLVAKSPIINGTLDGESFDLSIKGESCLYHSDLPNGVNDIAAINTSNETLGFNNGSYSLTVTIHGTAVQHIGAPIP